MNSMWPALLSGFCKCQSALCLQMLITSVLEGRLRSRLLSLSILVPLQLQIQSIIKDFLPCSPQTHPPIQVSSSNSICSNSLSQTWWAATATSSDLTACHWWTWQTLAMIATTKMTTPIWRRRFNWAYRTSNEVKVATLESPKRSKMCPGHWKPHSWKISLAAREFEVSIMSTPWILTTASEMEW